VSTERYGPDGISYRLNDCDASAVVTTSENLETVFVVGDDAGGYASYDDVDEASDGPDGEGYFWFEGRADDVVLSSGYRIGPFEVESSLGDDAVAESAVVPKTDEKRGNIVKAYVVTSEDTGASETLKQEIKQHVKGELPAHEYPREVEFVDDLPKTVTGKIRRKKLREQEHDES